MSGGGVPAGWTGAQAVSWPWLHHSSPIVLFSLWDKPDRKLAAEPLAEPREKIFANLRAGAHPGNRGLSWAGRRGDGLRVCRRGRTCTGDSCHGVKRGLVQRTGDPALGAVFPEEDPGG